MKVLTIGMDGAGCDVFNRGWTPKIARLLEKSSLYRPKNDLISRGWVEIASGEHGLVTGALYDYPHCNGTYEWSTEYSLSHMKKYAPGRKWFWSALNEIGFRTGILNLPTTFPAPAINGFIVSGGGGGAPVISTPTKELIFPKEILPLLKTTGYIVDERLYQLVLDQNIKDASGILDRLKNKNQKRVDTLLSLYEFDPVDLGFITFKTSSVMVETLIQVDLFKMENGANYDNDLINEARKYYGHFDSLVDKLVSDIQPECVIFISDHGMTRTTHKFNPNIMLQNLGYQKILAADQSKRKLHSYLRKLVPSRIKRSIKSILKAKNISIAPVFFDARATSAFCRTFGDWRSGIYINDSARFKGPIASDMIKETAKKISSELNSKFSTFPIPMSARVICKDNNLKGARQFPDIVIDCPDGILFDDKMNAEIVQVTNEDHYNALKSILKTEMRSVKSSEPIFAVVSKNNTTTDSVTSLQDYVKVVRQLLDCDLK